MKVGIIGNGLTSLSLAKILVNMGINVDIYSNFIYEKIDRNRTLSISKDNLDFFNLSISNINKFSWKINKLEIFSENLKNEKILNFDKNQKELFSIIKNHKLIDQLKIELKSKKLFKLKKISKIDEERLRKNYNLIINCDPKNFISKKYFLIKLIKIIIVMYTTIINHKRYENNNTAIQIFTKNGPLAFLPISDHKTSVVYSIRNFKKINFENLLESNTRYSIIKINDISKYELKSWNLRSYYNKNILGFGDILHKLHPLAGQGFNMTIRDIKLLSNLIKLRMNNGLEIDSSICQEFEKKSNIRIFFF